MNESDDFREENRLRALRDYDILDTPQDGAFDRVTELAASHFGVPVAIVSLVDEDRIWFKSAHGLDAAEIPRAPGLCASVICSDEVYVVENALKDPRTLANPLVAGELGVRFYAAAPLVTHDDYRLGTVNIIDFKPRTFNDAGERFLELLAGTVMEQMELRLSARTTIASLTGIIEQSRKAFDSDEIVTICAWSKKIKVDEDWVTFEEFLARRLGVSVSHGIEPTLCDRLIDEID